MATVPGSLHTRKVGREDANTILEVYRQCEDFLVLGPRSKASLDMVLDDIAETESAGGVFNGIFAGRTMIGVFSYVAGGFEGQPANAFIILLMLIPSFRGRGIGTRIVEVVEKRILKNREVTAILSGVQVNNPRALRFWQQNGYRIVGRPELLPDKTTVFHLRKDREQIVK
jgi:ribosomal protein S18 acetylase RimI-like enzyme